MSPATIAAIQGGWTDLVIDQQPWLQGYLPILHICLTKVYGSPASTSTPAGVRQQVERRSAGPARNRLIR